MQAHEQAHDLMDYQNLSLLDIEILPRLILINGVLPLSSKLMLELV
ncbi:hypothetical protein ACVBEG_27545 [Pseudomonas sp. GG8]